MKAVVINNLTHEIECICESPENFVTKKFYKFVRSAMFCTAAQSIQNRDLSVKVGEDTYHMITRCDYDITADFYINGTMIRQMVIAC